MTYKTGGEYSEKAQVDNNNFFGGNRSYDDRSKSYNNIFVPYKVRNIIYTVLTKLFLSNAIILVMTNLITYSRCIRQNGDFYEETRNSCS